jgi:hypothetical protein
VRVDVDGKEGSFSDWVTVFTTAHLSVSRARRGAIENFDRYLDGDDAEWIRQEIGECRRQSRARIDCRLLEVHYYNYEDGPSGTSSECSGRVTVELAPDRLGYRRLSRCPRWRD